MTAKVVIFWTGKRQHSGMALPVFLIDADCSPLLQDLLTKTIGERRRSKILRRANARPVSCRHVADLLAGRNCGLQLLLVSDPLPTLG